MRRKTRQKRQSEPFDGVSSEELARFACRAFRAGNTQTAELIAAELFQCFRGWLTRQRPAIQSEQEAKRLFFDYIMDYESAPHQNSIIEDLQLLIRERARQQSTTGELYSTQNMERHRDILQAASYQHNGIGSFTANAYTSNPENLATSRVARQEARRRWLEKQTGEK